MPNTVANPEISISQRTRATIRACSGVSLSCSSSKLFGVVVILDEEGPWTRSRTDMVKEDAIKAETMPQGTSQETPQGIPEDGAAGMAVPAVHTATVGADEDGLRLDRALAAVMNGLSR